MEVDATAHQKTGWKEINDQHMLLIKKIAAIRRSLTSPNRRETQKQLIDDLLEFADAHFHFEEGLLKNRDSSECEALKNEHEAFIEKTARFRQKLDAMGFRSAMELLSFLTDWLPQHIQTTDVQYSG